MAYAQSGDTAHALADLKKVIEMDSRAKKRAAKDDAFKSLRDNAEFKSLTR